MTRHVVYRLVPPTEAMNTGAAELMGFASA